MFKNILENKDLIVFWTAVIIAACDLLPLERLAIPEVTAAPSSFGSQAVGRNERPWLEHQAYAMRDRAAADRKDMDKSMVSIRHHPSGLN